MFVLTKTTRPRTAHYTLLHLIADRVDVGIEIFREWLLVVCVAIAKIVCCWLCHIRVDVL